MATTFDNIYSYTVPSNTSSVSLSSIPNTYDNLVIVCMLKATSTIPYYFRWNNDTGNNYVNSWWYRWNASIDAEGYFTQNYHRLGYNTVGQSTEFSPVTIYINGYADTSFYKSVRTFSGAPYAVNESVQMGAHEWQSTSAINRLTLLGNPGDLIAAGSSIDIYGVAG